MQLRTLNQDPPSQGWLGLMQGTVHLAASGTVIQHVSCLLYILGLGRADGRWEAADYSWYRHRPWGVHLCMLLARDVGEVVFRR